MIYFVAILGLASVAMMSVSAYLTYTSNRDMSERLSRNSEHLDRANELFRAYLETGDQSYLEYVDEELEKIVQ